MDGPRDRGWKHTNYAMPIAVATIALSGVNISSARAGIALPFRVNEGSVDALLDVKVVLGHGRGKA